MSGRSGRGSAARRPGADQVAVERGPLHQFLVAAVRGPSAVHDQHPVGAEGGADAVRHDHEGAAPPGEGALHALLGRRVQVTGRLVEQGE
ncbi:hypothetical protein ACRJ4B_05455 [Streptomyces sp. GTA36]